MSDIISNNGILSNYHPIQGMFDEVADPTGNIKEHYRKVFDFFSQYSTGDFDKLNELAKISFFNQGITFAVYNEKQQGNERIFPFDLFPRIIPASEWEMIEKGAIQRNTAINLFLQDIYHDKKILNDKIVPAELIFSSKNFIKQMEDFTPVGNIYNHISGTDLIRHKDGKYYVLEDNVRCPSGVSYVLFNRKALKNNIFGLFQQSKVSTVQEYPVELLSILQSVAPEGIDKPNAVVLTPGIYNSAYYEHSFLAQAMGIQLVEGRDLFVENNFVYVKTIYGQQKVDIIYRRVDDAFIDPLTFNPDSVLGVAGLMSAYRMGNVTLANAPGTGVSDDKAVYTYMPDIIKYYLNEEPILNNVHTYRCEKDDDLKYVLEHMDELVIKPVDESGGYGILVGSQASEKELEDYKKKILEDRRKYIAQPIMSLSMHGTFIEDDQAFEPRHIDLRLFTLLGKDKHYVLKGGLTRVALRKGSLIVNSSQGGGSKDTWVLQEQE